MLTVGQLAKVCDVGADTVRYYERIGLIDAAHRTDAGYRQFPRAVAERIRFIKNAQALGFELQEIKRLLTLSGGDSDCSDIRQLAEDKILTLEEQLCHIHSLKRELQTLVRDCSGEGVPLKDCNILAKLNSTASK